MHFRQKRENVAKQRHKFCKTKNLTETNDSINNWNSINGDMVVTGPCVNVAS